jgi:hypothetical protein
MNFSGCEVFANAPTGLSTIYNTYGGGIFCGGTGIVDDCWIYQNETGYGGGGIYANSVTVRNKSRIFGNTAVIMGGGISANNITLDNSSVYENKLINTGSGTSKGGGIYCDGLGMRNSEVHGNEIQCATTANAWGGGIYIYSHATLTNPVITSNTAKTGGGVYIASGANVAMTDFTSSGNVAPAVQGQLQGSGVAKMSGATLTLKTTSPNQTKVWGSSTAKYLEDPSGPSWFN